MLQWDLNLMRTRLMLCFGSEKVVDLYTKNVTTLIFFGFKGAKG